MQEQKASKSVAVFGENRKAEIFDLKKSCFTNMTTLSLNFFFHGHRNLKSHPTFLFKAADNFDSTYLGCALTFGQKWGYFW